MPRAATGAGPVSSLAAASGSPWLLGLIGVLNVLVGGLLVQMVRTRPTLKKIANEREANLLEERAADMEEMRAQRAAQDAEIRALNHKLRNVEACFDALLLLLEMAPEKATEHVSRIRAMRAEQVKAEATEKGAILGATIVAAGSPA